MGARFPPSPPSRGRRRLAPAATLRLRAESIAASRGGEVNDGYYLVNDVVTLRAVPVDGVVPAEKAKWEGDAFTSAAVCSIRADMWRQATQTRVDLRHGGVGTAIAVQHIPWRIGGEVASLAELGAGARGPLPAGDYSSCQASRFISRTDAARLTPNL